MKRPLLRTPEERREAVRDFDEQIARMLRESEASGELQRAPSYGKPLAAIEGYLQTPEELRMGMKILKDAGVVPPEVELMQRIAALLAQADASSDADEARALRERARDLRLALSLRLEHLRLTRSL
ncbi:MAG TPA: DUF1992 domain-containing protein [Rubrivivax sp.]|nr:DUF1992 domain-containing protein [Burkholderiales bacterium]HNU11350.1 DUF1992 domain-containing protein [Rubrivivax sp.]